MYKYQLTVARALLFSLLLGSGIIYLVKDGIEAMSTTEILLGFGLLLILLLVLLSGVRDFVRKED